MRRRWSAALGAEVEQRVLAGDGVVPQPARSPGAEHDRAVLVGPHHHEPDPGMLDQRRDQARMERLDLRHRHPVIPLRQRDQPQPTGGEDDGGVSGRVLLLLPRRPRGQPRERPGRRRAGRSVARATSFCACALLIPCIGECTPDRAQPLVAGCRREDVASGQRAPHQLLQLDSVALAERAPLALPMVRQHYQVVGARRLLDRPLEPGKLCVVLAKHRESVGLLDSRSGAPPRRSPRRSSTPPGTPSTMSPSRVATLRSRMITVIAPLISGYIPPRSMCSSPRFRCRRAALSSRSASQR